MDKLEIEFQDGNKLECEGTQVSTEGGSLRAARDGTFTEVRDSVQFEISEGTIYIHAKNMYEPADLDRPTSVRLQPGLYLINVDGLWRHL